MAILVFQHGDDAGAGIGRLGPILRDHGFTVDIRRLDKAAGGRNGTAGHAGIGGGAGVGAGAGVPGDYDGVQAVISLGGPMNVSDAPNLPWMQREIEYLRGAHDRRLPVIGICLGHQLLAAALGGQVARAAKPEWGFCRITQTPPGNTDVMLAGIPWTTHQFQSHFCEVTKAPEGATVLASSPDCRVQCFKAGLRSYGFQYHFEYTRDQIEGFARDQACQKEMAQAGLTPPDLLKQAAEHADTFDRLSNRLCANIAAFMFPATARLR